MHQFLGLPANASVPLLFTSEALSKRLPRLREPFPLTNHSFFSASHHFSIPAGLQSANIPRGPTAMFLMAAPKIMSNLSSARSSATLPGSATAFCLAPSLHPRLWIVGMNVRQLLFRPTPSLYRTSRSGLYLCGASTPPGGGVHGMCGFHAAKMALADLGL